MLGYSFTACARIHNHPGRSRESELEFPLLAMSHQPSTLRLCMTQLELVSMPQTGHGLRQRTDQHIGKQRTRYMETPMDLRGVP